MYNNQSNTYTLNSTPKAGPPTPPAQRPSELAAAVLQQAEELNSRLENLRYRLYGDSDPKEQSAPTPAEMSIEATIQAAHFSLNQAISQLDAIQNRL